MVTLRTVVELLQQDDIIQISPVYRVSGNRYYFKILKPIRVRLSNKTTITIPKGFKTDLSSVPNWLWFIFSPYGNFLLAAIIHDYMYVYNVGTRKNADKEMLIWSNKINPDRKFDNYLRYLAVRVFGKSWWKK